MGTPKLSFTFTKQKRPLLTSSKVPDHSNEVNKAAEREYIKSIEDKVIHSDKPKDKQLVIPIIHSRNGIRQRIQSLHKETVVHDPITEQAIRELKRGAEVMDDLDPIDPIAIPTKNLVLDDQPDDINYEAVPVEQFGLAVLAGMGFDPSILKSTAEHPVGPRRPKGLGLGADPHAVQAAKQDAESKSNEKLSWRPGARCQSVLGKHKGMYATVDGLDGDTGRVIVKFTVSKEVVPVLQHMLRLVSEKEYSKYSTCINQNEVEEYKAAEAKQHMRNGDSTPEHPTSHRKPPLHSESTDPKLWVRPNLVVRFLDKRFKDGRYYKEKVVITAVESGRCTCQTASGRLIEDVNPKYLQTVVPRENNSHVMILSGPRAGETAKLVDQNLKLNEVDLRTRAGTMIQLTYEQVCSFVDSR